MVWLEKTPGRRRHPIQNLRDEKEPVITDVEEGNSRQREQKAPKMGAGMPE